MATVMQNSASQKQTFIVAGLSLISIAMLAMIYFVPIWWVSLTAPNYPPEAFPDGVRIHFHMNGVFNGCEMVEKAEIQEDEALDCVHEMDTINHYVGMYPISTGGPVERGYSQFLISFLIIMLIGFICTKPRVRTALMAVGFAGLLGWMYATIYGNNGVALQSAGYLTALVTALDQDTSKEIEVSPAQALIDRMQQSLAASGVDVDETASKTDESSEKELMFGQLKTNFETDIAKRGTGEEWNGSSFQVISWHYTKTLGRYFNNPEEITPMVGKLKLAVHGVFVVLVGAMLLLLWGAAKNIKPLYWLLVAVPIALPIFFIIDYAAWLWWFGHNMNEMGAFTVKPFMPTVFGQGKVAQFATHSYPYIGFGLMVLSSLALAIAALIRRKQFREGE
ncbi:hypothetical protein BOW53_00550 [Solemya pervernicosa gill symbiont]|uniref:Cytochrome C n=2 Tax=Solemya pervernicosa gill symbiont TaxID=642797 RepID=A0A1T2LBB0_9GAMM|nr:hypothetical protein BOW53_00550 [Solemya pervernicosa gill symbiont]